MSVVTPTFLFNKIVATALLVSVSMVSGASEPRGWLCVGKLTTGFEFAEGIGWRAATFEPETFVVSKPSENDLRVGGGGVSWIVEKMGVSTIYYCEREVGLILDCTGLGGSFLFNKAHLKFQETRDIGYVQGFEGERPRMQIGTCAKI